MREHHILKGKMYHVGLWKLKVWGSNLQDTVTNGWATSLLLIYMYFLHQYTGKCGGYQLTSPVLKMHTNGHQLP